MDTRWMSGALLAGWLGLAVAAHAQYLPSPVGAARMPEPLPAGGGAPAAPCPDLTPGPINPQVAPQGPPSCLDLPANHSNAFQCEEYIGDGCHLYASLGAMALQRNKPGAGDIAILDPLPSTAYPTTIPTDQSFIPKGQPDVQRFKDLTPPMAWGVRGTIGVLMGNDAVELTTWGIFNAGVQNVTIYPGRIDTLFYNQPVGFFPAFVADGLITTQSTALFNAELNCRKCEVFSGLEVIAGFRYMQIMDALSITTIQNLSFPQFTTQEYAVTAYNRLYTGQLGFEYNWCVPGLPCLALGLTGKAAVGANYIHDNVTLTQPATGYLGFNTPHHAISLGQIYEISGFFDFHLLDRVRLRAGYMTLWVVDVATAPDQVDFNLRGQYPANYSFQQAGDFTRFQPHGLNNNSGSLFFHGPMIEAQFLF